MKKILIAILTIATFFSSGCKNNKHLDPTSYNKIVSICPGNKDKDLIVYYFDGDCELCFAKAKFLEEKYNDVKDLNVIFIARTFNPDIFKNYVGEQKIKSCVYLENKNEFEKVLKFDNVIELNTDRSYHDIALK